MKKILLPLDACPDLNRSLDQLVSFLKSKTLRAVLLHAYAVPLSDPDRVIATHDLTRERSLRRLEVEMQNLKKSLKADAKISFETQALMGSLPNVITRTAKENTIDCIVLEKNGALKSEEIAAIVEKCPCAIFILPSPGIKSSKSAAEIKERL